MAGGVVLISPWPSHPYDGQCRRATILNMYTDPPFRRQGIARRLMQTMIDWCREEGFVHVTLHASDKGRPLYESLGFEATNEMRLKLRRLQCRRERPVPAGCHGRAFSPTAIGKTRCPKLDSREAMRTHERDARAYMRQC